VVDAPVTLVRFGTLSLRVMQGMLPADCSSIPAKTGALSAG